MPNTLFYVRIHIYIVQCRKHFYACVCVCVCIYIYIYIYIYYKAAYTLLC